MTTRRIFLKTTAATILASAAFPAFAGGHGRLGTFTGKSNHVTSGRAEIVTQNGKSTIHLLSDFKFDGAPDPKIALGNNGYDKNTLLGPLKSNSGKQSYEVPANIDVSQYNEVWVWCEKFNVPLGVASIK